MGNGNNDGEEVLAVLLQPMALCIAAVCCLKSVACSDVNCPLVCFVLT
jgi:hypothetical protein